MAHCAWGAISPRAASPLSTQRYRQACTAFLRLLRPTAVCRPGQGQERASDMIASFAADTVPTMAYEQSETSLQGAKATWPHGHLPRALRSCAQHDVHCMDTDAGSCGARSDQVKPSKKTVFERGTGWIAG